MNNSTFKKTMENVRKYRDIRLLTTGKRRSYLVSEQNYHTVKWFLEKLLGREMRKTKSKNEQTNLSSSDNIRNQ